ncbi:integrase arm-type DNA-binding domain-containing protein [Yoonia rosea]|uniref:integrase arm-type DNA-binding domain-containing protein n=1 Tax=Yoonia rosea TaxID=287098 RepID=UPI0035CBF7B0
MYFADPMHLGKLTPSQQIPYVLRGYLLGQPDSPHHQIRATRQAGGWRWPVHDEARGRRREMGLGGLKVLSVKDAWDLAYGYRTLVAKGKDPIEHRRKQRRDAMRNLHLL